MATKEKRFFDTLKNIFIGVPVEGESGYINLMRIKARYFERVMEPRLRKEIDESIKPFPAFQEELFDKLYSFFRRYFTESGSIGFFFTPYHQSVYERVYTDDQDVMFFWKTARLYYIKTDRLFRSMKEEVDGFRFFFDVSNLEHKKANEKRNLVFTFKERWDDGTLAFTVAYSERGRQTNMTEIRRAIKDALGLSRYTDAVPSEETLTKAFRLFERQSEVDYFICKDAKAFLREQFDLWLWQYLLGKPGEEPEVEWTETRLKQLQTLKRIAYRVIDFIAVFENELVKIWNKPKFVLRSNYVITLDRIYDRKPELLERIIEHPGFTEQVKEWQDLGVVGGSFSVEALWEADLTRRHLHSRYRFLPLDTRYFKDLELEILGLFDNLDEALDGWLIKSENYQALNTILRKFKEKVQTIYIDPPFNTGEDFLYKDKFQNSSWLTLMENRLELARNFLCNNGNIFVHLDWNANFLGRSLLEKLFPVLMEIVWNTNATKDEEAGLFSYKSFGEKYVRQHDTIFQASKTDDFKFIKLWKPNRRTTNLNIGWLDLISYPNKPNPNKIDDYDFFVEKYDEEGSLKLERIAVEEKIYPIGDIWNDIYSFTQSELRTSENISFGTQKPENLLRRIIQSSSEKGDIIMDFFAGSGTTVAVSHKLKRKWIGIEMANCFNEFYHDGEEIKLGILGRMKIVLAGDKRFVAVGRERKSHLSIDINWQGGGFFKYYELEQYEDVLRRARYLEDDLFTPPPNEDPCQYVFLRDPKMLEALEVNLEQGTVKVDLSKLYEDIDLAETLSNLTGKWIKRIHPDPEDPTRPGTVEFADGTTADLKNPDWRLIKPLIWW